MLALLKNEKLMEVVPEGVALKIPSGQNVIYVSPATAGWSYEDYSLIAAPDKPSPPDNMTELSAELRQENGNLVWDTHYEPVQVYGPEVISDRQFFQILAIRGLITKQEALAAVTTGALPAAMEAMVVALPEEDEFNARMLLQGATAFLRAHPLTEVFGAGFGMDAQQLDQLWIDGDKL